MFFQLARLFLTFYFMQLQICRKVARLQRELGTLYPVSSLVHVTVYLSQLGNQHQHIPRLHRFERFSQFSLSFVCLGSHPEYYIAFSHQVAKITPGCDSFQTSLVIHHLDSLRVLGQVFIPSVWVCVIFFSWLDRGLSFGE